MTDEVVTRLYRVLVEELRQRGHPEGEPVKVSDLYQTLIPYRAVRPTLGVELNADYEHALLRLLAGERGLLRLEPEQARDELAREVDAPYPSVGLFRKFSDASVWINWPRDGQAAGPNAHRGAARQEADAPGSNVTMPRRRNVQSAPEGPFPRIAAEHGPPRIAAGGGPAPAAARPPVQLHDGAEEPEPSERLTHAGAACAFCGDDLPTGRRVRFCPHCGGDQRLQPCPRCEAVLEREWRYCISCGHEIA